MSHYCNYSKSAVSYDSLRVIVGERLILDSLAHLQKPISHLNIGDLGCGTGNYTCWLENLVQKINAYDSNPEMLSLAKKKSTQPNTTFQLLNVLDFNYANDVIFDCILMIQVLHHLCPIENKDDHSWHISFFKKIISKLYRPGIFIINTCTMEQLKEGHWFYHFIPEAADRLAQRYTQLSILIDVFKELGASSIESHICHEPMHSPTYYFQFDQILDPNWRCNDSVWDLVEPNEILEVEKKIKILIDQNRLQDYCQILDNKRRQIGQSSFLIAQWN